MRLLAARRQCGHALARYRYHVLRGRDGSALQRTCPVLRNPDMSTLERETRTTTTLELTVVEGLTVPRGEAYVTLAALSALDCAAGEIVQITGRRATVARIYAWPEEPSAGNNTAREPQADRIVAMEGMVRQNAGASLGEPARLRRGAAPAPPIAARAAGGGGGAP